MSCLRGANRQTPARVGVGKGRSGLLPEWVVERSPLGVHGSWGYKFGVPAGVEPDVPSLTVHDDVMVLTE